MTATMLRTSDPHNVTSLIDFALDSLPAMQHKDGAFCFERRVGNPAPLGRSPRYTLMVELGLLRAQTAGYTLPIDPDELNTIAWRELDTGNLTPGDIGLMLWTDARRDRRSGHKLAEHLTHALQTNGGLQARLGMELGWIITGLAHHQATNPSQTGARLLTQALDQLLTHNRAPTGLFRHFGNPGWRRRFPNFATQIYSVLALATVARHDLDDRALPAATTTANHLLAPPTPRRRLALALRRRTRQRRRTIRNLLRPPRRHGPHGPTRTRRTNPRPTLHQRHRTTASPGSTATTNSTAT